jgi:photosystem II stability/assembly factor-like uncharacterized protein
MENCAKNSMLRVGPVALLRSMRQRVRQGPLQKLSARVAQTLLAAGFLLKKVMIMKLVLGGTVLAFLSTALNSSFAQNWTQSSAPIANLIWTSVASSADGSEIYAAAQGSTYPYKGPIYTSVDSGGIWISNAFFPPQPWQAIASSADGTKLVATAYTAIYTSTNSGATWKLSRLAPYCFALALSADGNRLTAAVRNSVYTSTDLGNTWTTNSLPTAGGVSLASSADGTKLAIGDRGSIYTSVDGGATWGSNSVAKMRDLFVASSADGNNLAAAAGGRNVESGPILISTNSGTTWMTSSAPTLMWVSIASSADGRKLIAAAMPTTTASNMVFTSSDSGFTWTSNNVPAVGLGWAYVASSADGNKLVAGSLYGGIWTYQTTPKPALNISCLSNSLSISWIVPAADLELQENSDAMTTNWVAVTNTAVLNCTNLQNQVILPVPADARFYRLTSR